MIVQNYYKNSNLRAFCQALWHLHIPALVAATKNGAIALRQSHLLGTLEAGKLADVLIVGGKPWQNISDLANIEAVIASGRVARNDIKR